MSPPVVVGIDGTGDGERALRFAVSEAARVGAGLRLVHAVHETVPLYPMLPLVDPDTMWQLGEQIMDEAAAMARRLSAPGCQVQTVVESGPASRVLLQSSVDARTIVLGHRHHGGLGRVLTGSTTTAVAAHANCPVVCVPTEWSTSVQHHRVVVGVDGSTESREALSAAFEAASARGSSLSVLHAWRLPDQYDAVVGAPVLREEWQSECEVVLAEVLAGWRGAYPDVTVDVDLCYDRPTTALVEASAKADLVLVGRHGSGRTLPLGSIARALVNHSHCPVVVVPSA